MLKQKGLSKRQEQILSHINDLDWQAATDVIQAGLHYGAIATIKRDLKILFDSGYIERSGQGRATKYRRSSSAIFLSSVDVDQYFSRDQDARANIRRFNLDIFMQLQTLELFTTAEKRHLNLLMKKFQTSIKLQTPTALKREFERVTIDLSWKSSSIEGNTYTLLETESLLKEGMPAEGKTSKETQMILNHKTTLDYIRENAEFFEVINVSKIELIHSLLTEDLDISKNVRKRLVGITGTNYKPLDNEFQIHEALEGLCRLLEASTDVFSKSLLAILLISYIQPFEDGNKRTARLTGNAVLIAKKGFPLSFRSVDNLQYKKAILLFYETNNLSAFKQVFIDQCEFSVNEYFC